MRNYVSSKNVLHYYALLRLAKKIEKLKIKEKIPEITAKNSKLRLKKYFSRKNA
jgi:hypothetical protein